ncbi:tRNA threonylcarbamoyladenosine biosynthesis protein TsaE [Kroppenstedtia eburnea]|uniref:tRNA threonylcarbamoyladenosine biosynthesis protein TsaE n=2 Tax=Kroppenstedtia eburnea TaxID=714067 RepID=A0A1N7P3B4_9BACL|nr:tRNA threonylcarbamoyladenosine biosynthesis protein TsaE [Kroppenstedtia eburnea]
MRRVMIGMEKVCLFKSCSPEETRTLARNLARCFQPGDVVLLEGDLGAGKTTFAQGVAIGLGIEEPVDSPTFTLIKEYHGGRLPLYHMDVYRIQSPEEELGWDEYFYGEGVTLVEWASRISPWLPEKLIQVELSHGENCRQIRIEPPLEAMERICGGLNPR